MMFNPDNPGTVIFARAFKSAAEELGIEPTIAQIHGLADIENAVAAAAAKPNGGVFVAGDVTINALATQTVEAVARHRVPAVYWERNFVTSGGLLYYGSDHTELFRRAASYVASCGARNPAIYLMNSQPSMNSSSTSRRPRRLA
jgi:ABC-type uncharacterized transport system substrate-binding protein